MSSGTAAWGLLLLALFSANVPFLTERLLLIGPRRSEKPTAWRIAELLLLWCLTMVLGFSIEAKLGQRQPQGWEFYAAFGFLFLTFAFPGFVWRYLRRRGRQDA